MTKRTIFFIVVTVGIVAALLLLAASTIGPEQVFQPTESTTRVGVQLPLPLAGDSDLPLQEDIATGLEIPWEIAWLPDGSMLVTERPGNLLRIATDKTVIPITGVEHTGEGGLLGLALHPDFADNSFIYLYLTTRSGEGLINRVGRYRLNGTTLSDRTEIISDIPGARFHDGGRIAFGPDGYLYVTTGDAGEPDQAQNLSSLAGKILRVTDDGSIPSDNPFATAVYSYGHRNPQGLAWDKQGQLWSTEHGRSGVRTGFDEVNLIRPGENYGWPEVQGDELGEEYRGPVVHSGASETWAPAGAVAVGNVLYFTGLRGESLYAAEIVGDELGELTAHFREQFGRLRVVSLGPDGNLYVATSNQDGRGTVQAGDDRIIRLSPDVFN